MTEKTERLIEVYEDENKQIIHNIPLESDGSIRLTTLQSRFPDCVGLDIEKNGRWQWYILELIKLLI